MNKALTLTTAAGLGAGVMYVLDPQAGNRRRALMRDKVVRAVHKTGDAIQATSCDLSQRATGLVAKAGSIFKSGEASDDVLVERVRSKMGRLVSHPSSIEVTVNQGEVTLKGPILAQEVNGLISSISRVPGVTGVENQLEAHEEPGDVPGLQGTPRPVRGIMQANWSPTCRLAAASAGCALAYYGAKTRNLLGISLGTIGLGLLARGLANRMWR